MAKDPSVDAKLQKMMAELNIDQKTDRHALQPPDQSDLRAKPRQSDQSLAKIKKTFMLPLLILAIPWTQEVIDQFLFQGRWNWVIHPRSWDGILGIFLSAFSHADFAHLMGNSIAFCIFSWLILLKSPKDFWITFLIGWLGGGFLCWLIGPQSVHGLSGVVYTLFGYLLAIGWLERKFWPLLLSVFVFVNYSYVIWGVLPTQPMVAWWGHLLGFVLGIFSAYGVYREPH